MGASSQPESNENPITAYEKRDYFSIFVRAVPEAFGDAKLIAKQTRLKKKNRGGPLLLSIQHCKVGSIQSILRTMYYVPSIVGNLPKKRVEFMRGGSSWVVAGHFMMPQTVGTLW